MIRTCVFGATVLTLLCVFDINGASAQNFYRRYVVDFSRYFDTYLWTEVHTNECGPPCEMGDYSASSTDRANFPYELGSDGRGISFGLHFMPKHSGKFIDTTTVSWHCQSTKSCSGGGRSLTRVFYVEAIADSGFYFPNNYFDLTLHDDTIRNVVLDTFSLEYYNKSATAIDLVGLQPLASDTQNYRLSILSVDTEATLRIDTAHKHGHIQALFETLNGPDTNRRSCFVQVELLMNGERRFDTLFVQYHSAVRPVGISISPDSLRFTNLPGAYSDTLVHITWSDGVDSIWVSTEPTSPFGIVGSITSDTERVDTYSFRSRDSRESATSTARYSFAERLYNGDRRLHTVNGPVLQWFTNVDSIPSSGSLSAAYVPLLDSVPSTPAGEVKIGTITVASPCTLEPSFTVLRYNSGLFHLSKRTDTTWAVWLKRISGDTGFAEDSARIYMTLTGTACPSVDVAHVSYRVFRQPPASVRANNTTVAAVWVSELEGGATTRSQPNACSLHDSQHYRLSH